MNFFSSFIFLVLGLFFIFDSMFAFSRIVGGYAIDIDKASYTVSLQLSGLHYCGGALISEEFILTAAHCELNYCSV
jgi:secreted trypsin-like serine protease